MTEEQQEAIEQKAIDMGWSPEESFRGDADKFVDAKTFVERGEGYIPFLKKDLKQMSGKLEDARSEVAGLKGDIKELGEYHKKTADREFKRAEAEFKKEVKTLKGKLREAAKSEDITEFDQVESELEVLEQNKPEKPVETSTKTDTQPQGPHPDFPAWLADNPWFTEKPRLAAYATQVERELAAKNPDLVGRPMMDEITKEIKGAFPEVFENPNRQEANTVDPGGNPPPGGNNKKHIFANLPDEAKQQYERFSKKIGWESFTKEQYCKEYEWED
ncbi:hypothetical protein LCGC14_0643110 [marine sediment metagenome]|uniref:Phage protein n=1 Tax=marine sediment metagenome TaxID=412755 RepID=A0A0F9TK79_9ZZZZ|nr:hypothetical protein [Candidatus Aminicenantes bacterium]